MHNIMALKIRVVHVAMVEIDVELDMELEATTTSASTNATSIESIASCHCVVSDCSKWLLSIFENNGMNNGALSLSFASIKERHNMLPFEHNFLKPS